MEKVRIALRDGTTVIGDKFNDDDLVILKNIFNEWKRLNEQVTPLEGRRVNIPDILSEGLFCYHMNCIRTNNTAKSYDCISVDTNAGIQIKSASIPNDCTSFGPTSTWDEIYFMDFVPNGEIDGQINIYKIDIDFSSLILNAKKQQTFMDQQNLGRRPRFSVKKKIIEPYELKPCLTINLN